MISEAVRVVVTGLSPTGRGPGPSSHGRETRETSTAT